MWLKLLRLKNEKILLYIWQKLIFFLQKLFIDANDKSKRCCDHNSPSFLLNFHVYLEKNSIYKILVFQADRLNITHRLSQLNSRLYL